jgi:outer membrane protein OmpA-like peptidoglycan-associated protein
MTTIGRTVVGSLSALLLAGLGCAHTAAAPPELVQADKVFARASAGPAAQLTPADLHEAKVLLDDAHRAVQKDPQSSYARHRSYLALRRVQLAEAQGKSAAAAAQVRVAHEEERKLLGDQLTSTRKELANQSSAEKESQGKLAQLEAEAQAQKLAGEKTQSSLTDAQKQLQDEREARAVAEERAQNAREALEKAGAVREEPRGTVITLSGSVLFAFGKSELLPSAQRALDQVAEALKAGNNRIVVEGHTDSVGTDAVNQPLSQRRALAVADYLASRGVSRDRLQSTGLGSSRPVADNSSAEGRADNRRVEIVVQNPMTARPSQ